MTNSALFFTILLAAIFMVTGALFISCALSPKSTNSLKGEPYECGIPTRGASCGQFKVGYYLFAILYMVFDIETVLLFPLAGIIKDLGKDSLYYIMFFFVVLIFGLIYAWGKGVLQWE
ncbi:MAG: NADH-quinone oxidoreductase subunit A [Bacteroidales bacterium OttesenSCG-928-I14]|jgi:NADH-quinone oxidoreductase subunit A|nr:NADH-quinone oxidoreductase subunit A [Bacteroidales bacterium OttesenSCG-928-I14]